MTACSFSGSSFDLFAVILLIRTLSLSNDAYIATAGGLHPLLLGQTMAIGWEHLWSELGPVVKRVLAGMSSLLAPDRIFTV